MLDRPESFQVVRLEDKAINIPPDFPITRSDGATDYDLQTLEDESIGSQYAPKSCWSKAEQSSIPETSSSLSDTVSSKPKSALFPTNLRTLLG
jgi:hypothetical protein